MQTGVCESLITCQNGFFPVGIECVVLPANCLRLNRFKFCGKCNDGFHPDKGECVANEAVMNVPNNSNSPPSTTQPSNQSGNPTVEEILLRHCALKNLETGRCEQCKPGRTFLVGTDVCA